MSEEQAVYTIERVRHDNAILRKYAALQKASEDKIGCQKIYIDMTDDLEAALVLDEIIYWTLPREETGKSGLRVWKDGYLWLCVRRKEWWNRKRLKPRAADLAIDKLESLGLIIKSVHRFNNLPSTHLRLNVEKFFSMYFETLEKENPPEDSSDSIASDLDDLYEMMGLSSQSPKRELQNGDSNSPIRYSKSPKRESINSPHTALTQPDNSDVQEKTKPASSFDVSQAEIGWRVAAGQTPKQEEIDQNKLIQEALNAFESDMQLPGNWQWYAAKPAEEKTWKALREFIVKKYAENPKAFAEYQTWRTQPYSSGKMSNTRIKNNPQDFEASWTDFLASNSMYGKNNDKPKSQIIQVS